MTTKNPFERPGKEPDAEKPKAAVKPRSGMALSTTSQPGIEVMSHGLAPNDYRRRVPQPESAEEDKTVKMERVRKTQQAPPSTRNKPAPPTIRRAGGVLATAAGFEVMDNNLSRDGYTKRVKEAQDPQAPDKTAGREKLTGENYVKLYRQQQAADKLEAEKKARAEKKAHDFAEKGKRNEKFFEEKRLEEKKRAEETFRERQKADAHAARARELQSQISGWRQKLGQNPVADAGIQTTIDLLMLELGQIPGVYR